MNLKYSRSGRQIFVVGNYLSVILLLLLFYMGDSYGWTANIIVPGIAFLASALYTFMRLHAGTGLWKLVHSGVDKLDERQVQISHEALRYAYAIFTILSLSILLLISVMPAWRINLIMIFASLLYLAHTLPSSILAWREKEV